MVKGRFTSITFAISALVGIILVGFLGFLFIEDYEPLDALFMTMITVSTVGFGEIHPLSSSGEVFTIILILMSFLVYAYAVTSITRFFVDGEFRNYYVNKKMEHRVNKLYEHIIICGFGRNGSEAASTLSKMNEKVLIIESDESRLEDIRLNYNYSYVRGSATDDDTLIAAGIHNAQALITTLPSDANNLLTVLTARSLNSEIKIISRASYEWSDIKLKKAGANNVIMPDMVGGRRMAKLVATPDIVEFLLYMQQQPVGEAHLREFDCCSLAEQYLDKSIGELKFRKISGVSLLGIKNSEGAYEFNPSPEMKLSVDHKLFVMANDEQMKKFKAAFVESP